MENYSIVEITEENLNEYGIFCIKDKKSSGYKAKIKWVRNELKNGLKILIALDENKKQIGFIEYIPSEFAWRPINAQNYLFIHCIMIIAKEDRQKSLGSDLIEHCYKDALNLDKAGLCVMSSDGSWMAKKSIFEKNGFVIAENKGRFELMFKQIKDDAVKPQFNNWEGELINYSGWNLVYSDQCPWHEKSVEDISQFANQTYFDLTIKKIENSIEAQQSPSGFGTFSLIKKGKLLEDHYLSKRRFESIVIKNK